MRKLDDTAPDLIFLGISDAQDDRDDPFPQGVSGDEVGWSSTPALATSVRYVKADLVEAAAPRNWEEDPDWVRLRAALDSIG
jgi:hypothetical protein